MNASHIRYKVPASEQLCKEVYYVHILTLIYTIIYNSLLTEKNIPIIYITLNVAPHLHSIHSLLYTALSIPFYTWILYTHHV